MNKKIGVTGASGYIGRALMRQPNVVSIDGDIRDYAGIKVEIKSKQPDLILHLAAITDPDVCEKKENEIAVRDVNVRATYDLANICESLNVGMVLMSTFQVFSGRKMFGSAYSETDVPSPVNFYGFSKFGAESIQALYPQMKIIRSSYIFDWSRLAQRIEVLGNHTVEYPTFLKRSFLHLNHFIESLCYYFDNYEKMPNILNIAASETISWYDFMCAVADELNLDYSPLPRTKDEGFTTPRPHKGGLNTYRSYQLGFEMYSYRDGIRLLKAGV